MRSGTNSLRVETGRWRGEALENRICMLCGETHFLLSCEIYSELRQQMYHQIKEATGLRFQIMQGDSQWILNASLGGGIGDKSTRAVIHGGVARFIRAALKQRRKLMSFFKDLNREEREKELDSTFLLVGRGGEADDS